MNRPPLPRLKPGERLLLCLDYDGTLVPLQKRPELAVIHPAVKKLLEELSALSNMTVAMISGRELANIKKMVGVKGLIYAGTHGMEIRGPKGMVSIKRPSEKERLALKNAWRALNEGTKNLSGTFAEKKKMALAAHYRNAPKGIPASLAKLAADTAETYNLRMKKGKKVFELLPYGARDKGGALSWIREQLTRRYGAKPLAVYIGDDLTDEDAFRELGGRDLPIIVRSRRKTLARYRLSGIPSTISYLTALKTSLRCRAD